MHQSLRSFERRSLAVQRTHRKLARGYVTKVGKNGVIQHQPTATVSISPLRILMPLLFVGFAFKVFALIHLGPEVYTSHLMKLEAGSYMARLGGWVMQVDPATRWVSELAATYLS